MLHEVRIYGADSKLKKTVSVESIRKNHWKEFEEACMPGGVKVVPKEKRVVPKVIRTLDPIKCVFCKKMFTPPTLNTTHCPGDPAKDILPCRILKQIAKVKAAEKRRQCPTCTKWFTYTRVKQRWCLNPCTHANRSLTNLHTLTCKNEGCDTTYETSYRKQEWCKKCMRIRAKRKSREYYYRAKQRKKDSKVL